MLTSFRPKVVTWQRNSRDSNPRSTYKWQDQRLNHYNVNIRPHSIRISLHNHSTVSTAILIIDCVICCPLNRIQSDFTALPSTTPSNFLNCDIIVDKHNTNSVSHRYSFYNMKCTNCYKKQKHNRRKWNTDFLLKNNTWNKLKTLLEFGMSSSVVVQLLVIAILSYDQETNNYR